jgi:hypothetical protein
MKTCKKCGGNAYRDFNPLCEHVFAPPPAVFTVVDERGEDVYEAYAGITIYRHPLKEQAIALAEAHLEKEIEQKRAETKEERPGPNEAVRKAFAEWKEEEAKRRQEKEENAFFSRPRHLTSKMDALLDREALSREGLNYEANVELYSKWLAIARDPDYRRQVGVALYSFGYTPEVTRNWSMRKRAAVLTALEYFPREDGSVDEQTYLRKAWLEVAQSQNRAVSMLADIAVSRLQLPKSGTARRTAEECAELLAQHDVEPPSPQLITWTEICSDHKLAVIAVLELSRLGVNYTAMSDQKRAEVLVERGSTPPDTSRLTKA